MISFVLTIVSSALIGAACGYLYARHVWQDRLLDMEETRQELRRKRLEIHREQFQQSTSRIHRPAGNDTHSSDMLMEELEQLRLDMMLLKEDHRLEKQMLEQENDHLRKNDTSPPDLSDVEETEVFVLEDEPEKEEPRSEPTSVGALDLDDAALDEVFEAPLVQGPRPESSTPVDESAPTVHDLPPAEDQHAVDEIPSDELASSDEKESLSQTEFSGEAESLSQTEHPVGPRPMIPSVPTDIESLFSGDTAEEPPGDILPDEDSLETSEQLDARDSHEVPDEDHETVEREDTPFSIHWQADRPLRRNHSIAKSKPESEEKEHDIPVFRSLHDMLQRSGVVLPVAPEDQPTSTSGQTSKLSRASEAAASEEASDAVLADQALVRRIVGLDADSFSLLAELGYADLRRLSVLSTSEIRRLAAVFRIQPDRIEQDWKPTAAAHVNMLSSSDS